MKVTRRTDSELELREASTTAWLILGVFAVGGATVLLQEGEILIAALFALGIAALALAFATSTTCRFDRVGGELACTRRSLLGATHVRHPLAQIVGVRVERSAAQLSQAYRVVLVLSTGATVPLTKQFTSGAGRHRETAQVIREFLGLADPVDVPIPGFGDLFRMVIGDDAAATLGDRSAGVVTHYETVVRHSPDDVEARRQLATALALSGRPAEARVQLEHARDVARRDGNDRIASELDEAIRRLDLTATSR